MRSIIHLDQPDSAARLLGLQANRSNACRIDISPRAGCGCKLDGSALADALVQTGYVSSSEEFTPQDSALREWVSGLILLTTDGGAPVWHQPREAAAVAVVHAFSDLYARGAIAKFALSTVVLADDAEPTVLSEFLIGIREACEREGAEVVNGQTLRGPENFLNIAAVGVPLTGRVLAKQGAELGDRILLSKPIGTGFLLRATALEDASDEEQRAVIEVMKTSNLAAMRTAVHAAHACTDVTGFGLIGHLAEMLPGLGARIRTEALPLLPGTRRLVDELGPSAVTTSNVVYARRTHQVAAVSQFAELLASDPQTSGPLLVMVPEAQASELIKGGYTDIGVVEAPPVITLI